MGSQSLCRININIIKDAIRFARFSIILANFANQIFITRMEKEKNKAQKMAAELLQQIPFVECKVVETPAFYTDNRTKKVRVCKINGELWVPTIELGYGSPETNRISQLRLTGELTSKDLLPLRSKGSSPSGSSAIVPSCACKTNWMRLSTGRLVMLVSMPSLT